MTTKCDQCGEVSPADIHTCGAGVQAAPVQSCFCPNCEAMGKELAALKAQQAQHEPDPCPGCNKGYVCRTPKCGRLKLPIDHPARTVIHPAHGITKGQP